MGLRMVQAELRRTHSLDDKAHEGWGSKSVRAFPSARRRPQALAFVGPSGVIEVDPEGGRGRQEFAPRSAARDPVA